MRFNKGVMIAVTGRKCGKVPVSFSLNTLGLQVPPPKIVGARVCQIVVAQKKQGGLASRAHFFFAATDPSQHQVRSRTGAVGGAVWPVNECSAVLSRWTSRAILQLVRTSQLVSPEPGGELCTGSRAAFTRSLPVSRYGIRGAVELFCSGFVGALPILIPLG